MCRGRPTGTRNASGADGAMNIVPGAATYKANLLMIEDAAEREKVVQEFRLLSPSYQNRDKRLEVMDIQGQQDDRGEAVLYRWPPLSCAVRSHA